MEEKLIRIGELAEMAEVSTRTVKYYEEMGLILPAHRSSGGFRYYTWEDLEKIKIIRKLQEMDYPLAKIKEFFNVRTDSKSGDQAAAKIIEEMKTQIQEIEEKIEEYKQLKEELLNTKSIAEKCLGCTNEPTRQKCSGCKIMKAETKLPLPLKATLD